MLFYPIINNFDRVCVECSKDYTFHITYKDKYNSYIITYMNNTECNDGMFYETRIGKPKNIREKDNLSYVDLVEYLDKLDVKY